MGEERQQGLGPEQQARDREVRDLDGGGQREEGESRPRRDLGRREAEHGGRREHQRASLAVPRESPGEEHERGAEHHECRAAVDEVGPSDGRQSLAAGERSVPRQQVERPPHPSPERNLDEGHGREGPGRAAEDAAAPRGLRLGAPRVEGAHRRVEQQAHDDERHHQMHGDDPGREIVGHHPPAQPALETHAEEREHDGPEHPWRSAVSDERGEERGEDEKAGGHAQQAVQVLRPGVRGVEGGGVVARGQLGRARRRDPEAEALRPVRTAHPRAGGPHEAADEDEEVGHGRRREREPLEPVEPVLRRGGGPGGPVERRGHRLIETRRAARRKRGQSRAREAPRRLGAVTRTLALSRFRPLLPILAGLGTFAILCANVAVVAERGGSLNRYWEDMAVAIKAYLDWTLPPEPAPDASPDPYQAAATVKRLAIAWTAEAGIETGLPWRPPDGRRYLAVRRELAPPLPWEDRGRANGLAVGFRLLGGVSPYLILWLGVAFALPVFLWTSWELFDAGHGLAGTVFLFLLASSPYFTDCLWWPHA